MSSDTTNVAVCPGAEQCPDLSENFATYFCYQNNITAGNISRFYARQHTGWPKKTAHYTLVHIFAVHIFAKY